MLRIWGKIWDHGKMKKDLVVEDDHKEWFKGDRIDRLEDILVREFDLARPIWLPKNFSEIEKYGSTKFEQDNFVENFPYQSFEMEIIEVDKEDE